MPPNWLRELALGSQPAGGLPSAVGMAGTFSAGRGGTGELRGGAELQQRERGTEGAWMDA